MPHGGGKRHPTAPEREMAVRYYDSMKGSIELEQIELHTGFQARNLQRWSKAMALRGNCKRKKREAHVHKYKLSQRAINLIN